jgi:ferritin-like protein
MPTITDDVLWNIGATARQAVRSKSEWVASFAKMASALAVGVVAEAAIEKLTHDDRQQLTKRATALATQRIADLVADIAEDLADDYV